MPETRITHEDVASTIEARRELGAEMEPAVVDAFVEKVEHAIEARVEQETARRRGGGDNAGGFALAIVSLATGIPITAIAAEQGGVAGILLAWLGIVGVNAAQRLRR